MTGAHPDDTKPKISIVNDIKLRLAERISLLDYNHIVEVIEDWARSCCIMYRNIKTNNIFLRDHVVFPCEICQIAIDFELI